MDGVPKSRPDAMSYVNFYGLQASAVPQTRNWLRVALKRKDPSIALPVANFSGQGTRRKGCTSSLCWCRSSHSERQALHARRQFGTIHAECPLPVKRVDEVILLTRKIYDHVIARVFSNYISGKLSVKL